MGNIDNDKLTRDYVAAVQRLAEAAEGIAYNQERIATALDRIAECVGEESASGYTLLWTYDKSRNG